MKDSAFAMTIKDLTKILDCEKSSLGVILSRSHYAQFETSIRCLLPSGKFRNTRAYCVTPEFVSLITNDIKKKRKKKNGNKN